MPTASELLDRLEGDRNRITRPFSEDILFANALLHNSAATDEEMYDCLFTWCSNHQPCLFGRSAAKNGRLHFALLREDEVRNWSDEEIAAKLSEERNLWKQRALSSVDRAAHSFIIVVASPKVAFSAPDRSLKEFAEKILELAGWANVRLGARRVNQVSSDYLYLQHPENLRLFGFQFNLDFFACAGDRNWWHDHRFPGGLAFTGNSTGHMRAFREWYPQAGEGKSDLKAMLGLAMRTIKSAAPTKAIMVGTPAPKSVVDPEAEGRVTWLVNLGADGRPLLRGVAPPWDEAPADLQGKDWTQYHGMLHTDHAVRDEFFDPRDIPSTRVAPYRMDFSYLYNQGEKDFLEFTGGREFTEDEIYAEIGAPETWTRRSEKQAILRSDEQAQEVAEQLETLRRLQSPSWLEQSE